MTQTIASASNQVVASQNLEVAHAAFVRDASIQHAHAKSLIADKETPDWLEQILNAIGEVLRALAPVISVLFWAGLGLLVALLIYFLVTEVMGIKIFGSKPKSKVVPVVSDWRPDAKEARDLLAAADKLAADGYFNEAIHLILLRSIEHIDRFRPMVVRPALTAREIGAIAALPDLARPIFVRIAGAVERTLFAGMDIDQSEFSACRQAYADFALPDGWRA